MKSSYTGEFNFSKYLEQVVDAETIHYIGSVVAVRGLDIESEGPRSVIGEICTIKLNDGTAILAEVVGLNEKIITCPLCNSVELANHKGKICDTCNLSTLGEEVIGFKVLEK